MNMTAEEKRSFATHFTGLTRRQRQVFDRIVRCKSSVDIAGELHISRKTVETHRMHINKQLGCGSAAELIRMALLAGAIDVDALE
jgi:FixJ family two-component response regulator